MAKTCIKACLVSSIMLFFAISLPLQASEGFSNGSFWVGPGTLSGNVTYGIGGNFSSPQPGSSGTYPFPLSKLEWPLNINVINFGGVIPVSSNIELSSAFCKNITTLAGKMKDSDYDVYGSGALVTYSESDSDLQAITADMSLRCWLFQSKADDITMGFGLGGGLFYEQFDWAASNVSQSDLTSPGSSPVVQGGIVGTYHVDASVPYLEIAGKIEQTDTMSLMLSFGYSPYALVNDFDNHLLRQITANASLRGDAYKISFQGQYVIASGWFVMAKGDLLSFDIRGNENDYVYGSADAANGNNQGDTWTIEHEATSTQYIVSLSVGRHF